MIKLCIYLKTNKNFSQKKQQQDARKVSLELQHDGCQDTELKDNVEFILQMH